MAQEVLYNKYKKVVFDYINFKYSNNKDIEDDVAEVLIKIFLNLKSYNCTKSKFRSWAITISNNHMIDKWRNKNFFYNNENITPYNIEWSDENCSLINSLTSPQHSYSATDFDFENINSINYLSTQISPTDFTLLDMKYNQGYNYSEIGKEFNLTSSTVSNKVNYIKAKLKKNFSDVIND